jgi:hypothetical protein
MHAWRERLRDYTRFGVAAGLLRALKRLLLPLAEVGTIVVIELPLRRGEPPAGTREAGMADLPALARAFEKDEDKLRARFERGDRAFIAEVDGAPVHVRWATTQPTEIPECGLWFVPGPGQIYLYDAGTVERARGRRHAAHVRVLMDDRLAADGYTGKLAYVRGDNHAMWHSMRDLAGEMKKLGRVAFICPRGRRGFAITPYRAPLYATPRALSG